MRLARKFALGLVTMSLIALIVPAGASAVPETPVIHIEKSLQTGQPGYYLPGDEIIFHYAVTGNDRFINVAVTDDKCANVVPVLGPGGVYNIGDTIAPFGALNGLGPETWEYTCTMTVPATPPSGGSTSTNVATVSASTPWPAFPGPFTDTDDFTLKGAVLRKLVVLFWDYVHYVNYPAAAGVPFDVDIYNGATKVGSEVVKANDPLELWLAEGGTWKLQEQTPDPPYTLLRGSWDVDLTSTNRDNTFFNLIDYDLRIDKYGPSVGYAGKDITYTYKVRNDGPASVKPVVTDDKCAPVTYVEGDDGDGLIQPGEKWIFTCTYTPVWSAAFPGYLKNTGTVTADEYPEAWTPKFGGDNDETNDSDYVKLFTFVLRKDVGVYNDGAYPDFGALTDTTSFRVKAIRDGKVKAEFTIAEGKAKYLWLSWGTWTFTEFDLPKGYMAYYKDATITWKTGSGYPDWTHLNVLWKGCSHGFYKNNVDCWPAGYDPTDLVMEYFTGMSSTLATATLADALAFGGGPGVEGAEKILLREAVASLLNEARYTTKFGPYASVTALKSAVNTALAGDDRDDMLALASKLGWWNNGVCRK